MIVGVADTHAALWHLFDDIRLSARAGEFIDEAENSGNKIAVSSISLAEIVYLVEKGRLQEAAYDHVLRSFTDPLHVFIEVPFTGAIAVAMRRITRESVPDMPDRMIAATAMHLKVPVLSRDRRILASHLETIW